MSDEPSTGEGAGASRPTGRSEAIALILLALLIAFHLINNWLWRSSNEVVYGFDRMFHQVSSLAHYEVVRESVNLRTLFATLTLSDYYPPLVHMTVILFYKLFGVSMDVAAMANSVYLILFLLAVYDIGRRVGGPWAGLLSAFVVSSFPIVFSMSRYLYIDYTLTALVAVNVALLLRSDRFQRKGYALLYGLSLGLGMLTKWTFIVFTIAPLLVVVGSSSLLPSAWAAVRRSSWSGRRLLAALLGGLALTAIWFLPNFEATANLTLGYVLVPLSWLVWSGTLYFALSPSSRGANLLAALGVGLSVASSWYLTKINFFGAFWLNAYGKPTGRSWGFRGYLGFLYREQLAPFFAVILILAVVGLVWSRWRRTRSLREMLVLGLEGWILVLWAIVPFIILSIQVSIVHSRYIMPLLPPLAIAIAVWLVRLRPHWARIALTGLVVLGAMFQFSALSYDTLADIQQELPFLARGLSIQLPSSGRTDSGYWVAPEVLQYVQDHSRTDPAILGIVVNEHELHSKHFVYLVYEDYPQVQIKELATIGWLAPVYPLLFDVDYLLMSDPPPEYPDNPDNNSLLEELIHSPDHPFHRAFDLVQTYPWPDGRRLLLYERRFGRPEKTDLTFHEALMADLGQHANPEDAVLVLPPEETYTLSSFAEEPFSFYPLPVEPRPLEEPDLQSLADLGAEHERLWVVLGNTAQTDPAGLATGWLAEHAYQASSTWHGPLQLLLYGPDADVGSEAPSQPRDATWQGGIRLLGSRFLEPTLDPGQILRLELQWQATEPIPNRLKVFVHLLNDQGQLVAQRDSEPGSGTRPTNEWAINETISDRHGLWLPADLADGEYRILLGLYDPETLERVPVCCPPGDGLLLAPLRVEDGTARLVDGAED
jgi:4-amino-4-deoxy-L-arabinose transferase-like glycosyltransferase